MDVVMKVGNNREYRIWQNIKRRCYYQKHNRFKYYGARGITMCEEWKNNFKSFLNWSLANGYRDDLTIDRIDNNGNYEPSNCRWVTYKEQCNNTSRNKYITFNGKTMTMAQWSRELGLKPSTIPTRLSRGWTIEKTLSTPNNKETHLC